MVFTRPASVKDVVCSQCVGVPTLLLPLLQKTAGGGLPVTSQRKDTRRPTPTILSFGVTVNDGWAERKTQKSNFKIALIMYYFVPILSTTVY